jgi:S-adenosylmethionine synthetase
MILAITYGTSKISFNDGEIAKRIAKIFDMRPYFIEQRFGLRTPIYSETAAYGHMGREPREVEKVFNKGRHNEKRVKVKLFPWEALESVAAVRATFGMEKKPKSRPVAELV